MDAKWFHNVSGRHNIRVPQRSDFVSMGGILMMKDYVKNEYGADASGMNHYEAMMAAAFFGYRLPTITELALAFDESGEVRDSMLDGSNPQIKTVDSEWTCDVYFAEGAEEHVLRKPTVKRVDSHPERKFMYAGGQKIDARMNASQVCRLKDIGLVGPGDSESIRLRPSRGPVSPVVRRACVSHLSKDMIEAEAWFGPETARNYIGFRFVKDEQPSV